MSVNRVNLTPQQMADVRKLRTIENAVINLRESIQAEGLTLGEAMERLQLVDDLATVERKLALYV